MEDGILIDKYKSANQTMEDLKYALNKYRKDNDRITRRAIFANFEVKLI